MTEVAIETVQPCRARLGSPDADRFRMFVPVVLRTRAGPARRGSLGAHQSATDPQRLTADGAPTDRRGYVHEAVLYDSDEEFLGVVVPVLQEGAAPGEPC